MWRRSLFRPRKRADPEPGDGLNAIFIMNNDEFQTARPNAAPMTASTERAREGVQSPKKKPSFMGPAVALLVVALLAGGGVWWVRKHNATSEGGRAGRPRAGAAKVLVTAGPVVKKDMPIYLDGLGTVQAWNTVTIHVRVNGELKSVLFSEGQDVRKGDVLAVVDPSPYQTAYDQALGKQAQDQALLSNAVVDLKRDDLLFHATNVVVSEQAYATQKALVAQYQAAVKSDIAAASNAWVTLNYCTVVSPIDGRTGIRMVDQGNIVQTSDTNGLVVVTQLRPIAVAFTLPEQTLWQIQQELKKGELTVLAVDRDNSTPLASGKLVVIDNEIDTTTATIKLKARFPNEDLKLWPGQFVNARLLLTVKKDSLVVPAPAIQRGPGGEFTFVIKPDMSVEMRKVKVSKIEGGEAIVETGLKAGDKVVVDGAYKLQPGSHVEISQPDDGASEDQ